MRRREQKRETILLDRHPRLKCRGHDGLAYATLGYERMNMQVIISVALG